MAALALDRRVRRPRRRRLRRVRAAHPARAREPVVEGLRRLAALPRRLARAHADRACRGAGVRLRREAAHRRAGARGLARPAARRAARARGRGAASAAFNERFWTDARGGYYVLALDGEKRQVDSLCSNIGHLLWSGIVPRERVDAVVDQLMGEELWSGWGVRTMSSGDAGYNPLAYHNGTVWPHDNSLIALGLGLHARWPEAQRIVRRMLSAAVVLRLPAAGGVRRPAARGDAVPDRLPDRRAAAGLGRGHAGAAAAGAARPAARPRRGQLITRAPEELPSWAGRSLRLTGIRAFDRAWDVRVEHGTSPVRPLNDQHEDRDPQPALVPGAADAATAGSSGSSRCSPTGSPTTGTT